jgi:hypothetical protein
VARDDESNAEERTVLLKTETRIQLFIQGIAYPPRWIYEQPWAILIDEEDGR